MHTLDAQTWLAEHGDYLFRVARRQLHSDELAEDAVQETLLAALSAQARYSGDASPRTWLTGILKHKIVDLIRRQVREVALPHDAGRRGSRRHAVQGRRPLGRSDSAPGAIRMPKPNSASCGACWTNAPTG